MVVRPLIEPHEDWNRSVSVGEPFHGRVAREREQRCRLSCTGCTDQ